MTMLVRNRFPHTQARMTTGPVLDDQRECRVEHHLAQVVGVAHVAKHPS